MRYDVLDAPDFGLLRITLERAGERIVAESGAMVAMDAKIKTETSMRGGVLAAAKRKVLGGESLFQNTFIAEADQQRLFLAPAPEGDLRALQLAAGQQFFLQSGAYVAHVGEELKLDTQWGGVRSFFGGLGFFMLKLTGPGTVFYASYGAVHPVAVSGNYICDTGHIVGFGSELTYTIQKFGGYKGLFFSGEGLVCNFSGQGQLLLQTRNPASLVGFLNPYRRVQSRS
ncbi:MAG TPA: TIGR00266 family protein [Polyangiaceae bacterium]|jgi:uncharacterized protein (TIGR00266 family)|nr:TIGR00266 family protein [Polyangiaceae bacterium]